MKPNSNLTARKKKKRRIRATVWKTFHYVADCYVSLCQIGNEKGN